MPGMPNSIDGYTENNIKVVKGHQAGRKFNPMTVQPSSGPSCKTSTDQEMKSNIAM